MDVAFAVAHERESGNVTVQCFKNRFGDEPSITVKPQFETGAGFEVTQDPAFQRQHEEERVLLSIIEERPGVSQSQIVQQAGLPQS